MRVSSSPPFDHSLAAEPHPADCAPSASQGSDPSCSSTIETAWRARVDYIDALIAPLLCARTIRLGTGPTWLWDDTLFGEADAPLRMDDVRSPRAVRELPYDQIAPGGFDITLPDVMFSTYRSAKELMAALL
ncbi:hypothetical protein C8J57DRAFT_1523138 [Mycena rebaudengoi]|nr:hypothetical protein C8J57DRAFT_1523138 [Mycena rebaudengoi]